MSNYLIKGETLTDIANAIRTKTGKTDSIPTENMATEISGLPIYPLYDGAVEEINLAYTLNSDGKSYSVSGIGNVTATDIVIYSSYNNLPVKEIGQFAFDRNSTITSANIKNGITTIGNYAFQNCYAFSTIYLPASITNIGYNAFYNTAVFHVYITDIVAWCNISGLSYLMRSYPSNRNLYLNGELITNLVIPNLVTSIGDNAFAYYTKITKVVFSNSVTSIGAMAFISCTNMQLYDFRNATAVPTLANANAFSGIPTTCKFVVPDSLYDSWIVASNWSTYASKIVKASEYTEA